MNFTFDRKVVGSNPSLSCTILKWCQSHARQNPEPKSWFIQKENKDIGIQMGHTIKKQFRKVFILRVQPECKISSIFTVIQIRLLLTVIFNCLTNFNVDVIFGGICRIPWQRVWFAGQTKRDDLCQNQNKKTSDLWFHFFAVVVRFVLFSSTKSIQPNRDVISNTFRWRLNVLMSWTISPQRLIHWKSVRIRFRPASYSDIGREWNQSDSQHFLTSSTLLSNNASTYANFNSRWNSRRRIGIFHKCRHTSGGNPIKLI